MRSYLKTTKDLLGALIAKKAFDDEEKEFQLQEKERQLLEKEKQLQEKEKIIAELKAKWKEHIADIFVPQSAVRVKPNVYAARAFRLDPRHAKHLPALAEKRPNNKLVITLNGDKGNARIYKWANGHWRFVICTTNHYFLIRRIFKDRKRCFAAAKEYIFSRAIKPIVVELETRHDPGARLARVYVERYRYLYQPLDTFYDPKAHEIELRGYTGGDDFDFVYWYTRGVNDAMNDTYEWDVKYSRNLEL